MDPEATRHFLSILAIALIALGMAPTLTYLFEGREVLGESPRLRAAFFAAFRQGRGGPAEAH